MIELARHNESARLIKLYTFASMHIRDDEIAELSAYLYFSLIHLCYI